MSETLLPETVFGPFPTQDKIQHLDFTKDPRPLYYKTPACLFYHKKVRSKAVFGP